MFKFLQSDKNGVPAIFDSGKQIISISGSPPFEDQDTDIFSQKFRVGGVSSGSDDLGIDGSVTSVEFCIKADNDYDIYITRITFILGYGSSAEGFEFADSGGALTNGVKLSYFNSCGEEIAIMNPKANYSFMRSSDLSLSNTNWEARGFAASGDYGFFTNTNILKIMPPYGIKLKMGTSQKICVTIRDDCTDADLFNCNAFGFTKINEYSQVCT